MITGFDLKRTTVLVIVAALALAVGLWGGGFPQAPTAAASSPPPWDLTVGLDMKTSATAPGVYDVLNLPAFEECVDVDTSVNNGIFYIDVFVLNVNELIAFNADLEFSAGMQILDSDINQFFGSGGGVYNLSDSTPYSTGTLYKASTLDTGGNHSGSGVLARLEVQAFIPPQGGRMLDFGIRSDTGRGVTLTAEDGSHPGDTDGSGDGIYDGTIINAQGQIAVDRADSDSDGISNDCDNCPSDPNPDQANNDGDAWGDVCDPDDDNDGILDVNDNCPTVPNPGQEDTSGNGVGDACGDTDGDGVLDGLDNCISTPNPLQEDHDGDGVGSACDPDDDNDGILDGDDNCPIDYNPVQEDWNGDSIGDACQNSDTDSWMDDVDNCPGTPNEDQADGDLDGVGNVCDNCPTNPNPDQGDWNGNGAGDACEDSDGDLYLDYKEVFMGTDPNLACSATPDPYDEDPDSFPPDFNDDQTVDITDVNQMRPPIFFTSPPSPDYDPRMDLNADNTIDISDVNQMRPPIFFSTCTQ